MAPALRPSPDELYVAGSSAIHRLAPEAKLAGLVVFVTAVAVTPRRHVAAIAVEATVVLAVWAISRVPVRILVGRMLVVLPVVAFAVFVAFLADGERTDVAGLSLSNDGLWATWNIVAKAGIGAAASIVISSTTTVADILHGLARLRVPKLLVAIVAFMVRYLAVLVEQLHRTRDAMTSRGHDPRWLWQARPIASSMGVVFVRSYERGERVHQAMLARGYDGTMPELGVRRATPLAWCVALLPAAIAIAALTVSLVA
jgi:cobalt/nickel transport system permease protein